MPNLYGVLRRQYDRTIRQLQQGSNAGTTYNIDPVTYEPSISRPAVDLPAHKESDDHDGRYYTEEEIDILITNIFNTFETSGLQYDLLTNGDWDNPELIFMQGEVIWVEV